MEDCKNENGEGSVAEVVPVSKETMVDNDHVEKICKAFISSGKFYDGTNLYAPRDKVYRVMAYGENAKPGYAFSPLSYKFGEALFVPTEAEISKALEEFKKKGWHAQYDSDVGYYAVFEGTRALGEYQAKFTRNLF